MLRRMMRGISSVLVVAALACGPSHRPNNGDDGGDDGPTPDADPNGPDGTQQQQTFVYAHTSSTLYKVDPDTLQVTPIGAFQWPNGGSDQMTDLAIDKTGRMIGISFGAVYLVDATTAAATLLSTGLTGDFNGLSFVPA